MKIEYFKKYSSYLNRDMEFKVYGHSGRGILVFPSQDGRFFDFENQGMVKAIENFILDGKVRLFCVDSIDLESWSSKDPNSRKRIEMHENYFKYITNELVPWIKQTYNYNKLLTTGCSMGASHALNFFLRRPDIFSGTIALSGVYDASYFFGDYKDELVYNNSPVNYINGMNNNHHYVDIYRNRDIILCVGQGAWEEPMITDTKRMRELFNYKNINAWIDIWGHDVNHDWPWWKKQLPYFLDKIC